MASDYTWSFKTGSAATGGTSGSLDPTFGTGGIVTTDIGTNNSGNALSVQSDGKIVVAGSSNGAFAVVRYNTDGTLDTTFGTGGIANTSVGVYGNALDIQSDGKIVVAGWTGNSGFAIVRYNTDGTLDTAFGTGGIVTTAIDGYGSTLAIQSDGKIVVAGYSGANFALARYNIDGTLDTTFGTGGIATTVVGGSAFAEVLDIQSDGKIVAAGNSGANFAIARYNIDGTLDTTFGTGGIVTTVVGGSAYVYALDIPSDGKIVPAGWSINGGNRDFALVRYNTDGTLDTTFGSGGIVTTVVGGFAYVLDMGIQSDGKLVVTGRSGDTNFALARYNIDGTLDTTFGTGGIITTAVDGDSNALAIQSDGKIVVVGDAINTNSDFVIVVRYLP